jgi:regulator of replication initiation timing
MSEKEDVLTENERLNLENAELKKNLEKANRSEKHFIIF